MTRYRKKPVTVEAVQWFTLGEQERVVEPLFTDDLRPLGDCKYCARPMIGHGWIKTLQGRRIVCPSDWIITAEDGTLAVCAAADFAATYEPVEEERT